MEVYPDKKILFLTSTNLASNPRCLKELSLAYQSGYQVGLLAFQLDNWTKDIEPGILKKLPGIQFHYISSSRRPFFHWAWAVFVEKCCQLAFKCGIRTLRITSFAASRRSLQMKWALRRIEKGYSLIVAHNPGAFYPAIYLGAKTNTPLVIDVEDYHPGEGNNSAISAVQRQLLIHALKKCNTASFASRPIMQETMNLPKLPKSLSNWCLIENRFPSKDFPYSTNIVETDKLQLVWFSQHIASSRGLEIILPLLDRFKDQISLTLIGQCNTSFFITWLKDRPYVKILPSLSQEELHHEIAKYDIGLAIEPGKDQNNDLAVSNKIWAYFQTGLLILATPTSGHIDFLNRFPDNGRIVELNMRSVYKSIEELMANLSAIRASKETRWRLAQQHGWEQETNKLIVVWNKLMTT